MLAFDAVGEDHARQASQTHASGPSSPGNAGPAGASGLGATVNLPTGTISAMGTADKFWTWKVTSVPAVFQAADHRRAYPAPGSSSTAVSGSTL